MFHRRYTFVDTQVVYREVPVSGHEGKTTIGLAVLPCAINAENIPLDSLVQVAFAGDEPLVSYSEGVTLRNRASTLLKLVEQTEHKGEILTRLTDGNGNFYTHSLSRDDNTGVFTLYTEYENRTGKPQVLRMLSSFSVSGVHTLWGNAEDLSLVRMTSAWSRECRLKRESFSELGLDGSWAGQYGVKCERWGQVGSMPNRGYYPFVAVEGEHCMGVSIEAPYSWQAEAYAEGDLYALSGGLGDFHFARIQKTVQNGEVFRTHRAFLCVKRDFNAVCNALVKHADARLEVPASEEELPVLFNEYCTTWGCPSVSNIRNILVALEGLPVKTFVIDCGWYKPQGAEWGLAVGDWEESGELFPNGISEAVSAINGSGMRAGIWFEFENACRDSKLYRKEELLLSENGKPVTTRNHRFLDLRLPAVKDYLNDKLFSFLKEKGFSYLKIDYNDAYALGEEGREVAEESVLLTRKLRDSGLTVENCASGGSRIEPLRSSLVSMCSFSDAHECDEIPYVAANVSRVLPARQMQIWVVLRKDVSRTVYLLCAGFMGRICLSGDVTGLNGEHRKILAEGLKFYETIRDIVRWGEIVTIDNTVRYYRRAKGRQIYEKRLESRRLVIVHFASDGEVRIPVRGRLAEAFTDLKYSVQGGELVITGKALHAGAFLVAEG